MANTRHPDTLASILPRPLSPYAPGADGSTIDLTDQLLRMVRLHIEADERRGVPTWITAMDIKPAVDALKRQGMRP